MNCGSLQRVQNVYFLNYYSTNYSFVPWEEDRDRQIEKQTEKEKEREEDTDTEPDRRTDRIVDRERKEREE